MKAWISLTVLWAVCAEGRIAVLYVDNPAGVTVRVATPEEATRLDKATDPVLFEKTDPDPCVLPPPKAAPRLAAVGTSLAARGVSVPPTKKLADLVTQLEPTMEETITVYGLSWDRLLEIRGLNLVSFPSEAVLPKWVEKEFPKTMEAVAERNSDTARLLYADLGAETLNRADWEKLGVQFPQDSASDAAPFFTRQDFAFHSGMKRVSLGVRAASRPHRVRFFTRVPWEGKSDCPAATNYRSMQKEWARKEALLLTTLTGWSESHVLSRQGIYPPKDKVFAPKGASVWPTD